MDCQPARAWIWRDSNAFSIVAPLDGTLPLPLERREISLVFCVVCWRERPVERL
jgi:hypothetical protein